MFRKLIKWLLILGGLLILVVAFLVYLVLYNTRFHEYVRHRIITTAEEATGGRVELRNYQFQWRNLQADFYGLIIHGTEKDPITPFFSTERLTVKLKILSVFKRQIDLREINVYRPKVYIWVDSQGRNNFPERRVKQQASQTDIFDLAIKTFAVSEGELYYNDKKIPLDFQVNNLQTHIDFDAARPQYVGQLAYRAGRLRMPPRGTLAHDLSARFEIGKTAAQITQLTVTSNGSQIGVSGTLTNYQQPVVGMVYKTDLDLGPLRTVLGEPQLPTGQVSLSGSARYDSTVPGPTPNGLTLNGVLTGQHLQLIDPNIKLVVHQLRGSYRVANGNAELRDLVATTFGGSLRASASVKDLSGEPKFYVQSSAHSLSLQELKRALGAQIENVQIAGTLDGQAKAEWRGSIQNVRATSDLAIRGRASQTNAQGRRSTLVVPIEGAIHAGYTGASQVLSLDRTYLRTPHTELRLQGTVNKQARLDFSVRSDDLREIDLLAADFLNNQKRGSAPSTGVVGLQGTAEVSGSVLGSLKDPRIAGRLTGRALQVRGTRWNSVQADLELSKSMIAVRRAQLNNAGGRIDLDLSAGLRNGTFTDHSPIKVQATVQHMQIGELQRLADVNYPLSGTLNMTATLTGSKARPVGSGTVQLVNARAWGEPIDQLSMRVQATGEEASISNLSLVKGKNTLTGDLSYHFRTEAYQVRLDAPRVDLGSIESLRSRGIPITGQLSLSASGRGTVKNPQLDATVRIPRLAVQREELQNIVAQINVANQSADFKVRSDMTGAFIDASGRVALDRDYDLTARINVRNAVLETLLAAYLPKTAPPLRGQFEATAQVNGPLKRIEAVQAEAEIPKLSLQYQNMDIVMTEPLRARYRNGALAIDRTTIKGPSTEVHLKGVIPLSGEKQSMDVALDGAADLRLLRIVNRELTSEGQARINVVARGDLTDPQVEGKLTIEQGLLSSRDLPLILSDINGETVFKGKRVEISRLTASSGGGQLSLSGFANLNKTVEFNLSATGQQIRVRYPEGVRILLDGDMSLQGTLQAAHLRGQVLISRASLTDNFDLAKLMNQFSSPSVPAAPGAFTRNLQLDLAVRTTEELRFATSKFSLQGLANLRIQGAASNPSVLGRINATGGELFFAGNRYRIARGIIEFINPIRIEPVLNISATATVNRYEITINVNGPFEKLRTNYVSDPPLPPVDVINLLAFGKTGETRPGETTATPPDYGATSILAKGVAGAVSSRMEKLFGLTRLQIDPSVGSTGRNPTARLAIQQRVSKDLIFTFATGISSTQQELIQIEYQATRRFSVTALRDENGSYALDIKFRKVF